MADLGQVNFILDKTSCLNTTYVKVFISPSAFTNHTMMRMNDMMVTDKISNKNDPFANPPWTTTIGCRRPTRFKKMDGRTAANQMSWSKRNCTTAPTAQKDSFGTYHTQSLTQHLDPDPRDDRQLHQPLRLCRRGVSPSITVLVPI